MLIEATKGCDERAAGINKLQASVKQMSSAKGENARLLHQQLDEFFRYWTTERITETQSVAATHSKANKKIEQELRSQNRLKEALQFRLAITRCKTSVNKLMKAVATLSETRQRMERDGGLEEAADSRSGGIGSHAKENTGSGEDSDYQQESHGSKKGSRRGRRGGKRMRK